MNLLKGAIVVPDLLNSYVAFSRNERLSSRVSVRDSHNACDILETAMIRDTHLINENRNEIKTWTNCVVSNAVENSSWVKGNQHSTHQRL